MRLPPSMVALNADSPVARDVAFVIYPPSPLSRVGTLPAPSTSLPLASSVHGLGWEVGANGGLMYGTGWGTFFANASFTLAAWCVPKTSGTRRVLISDWNDAGANSSVVVQITSGNVWEFYTYNGAASQATTVAGATTQPTLVVARLTVGTGRDLWVNGVKGTQTTMYTDALYGGAGPRNYGGSGGYVGGIGWNGTLHMCVGWYRALADVEIAMLFSPERRFDMIVPA